VSKNIREQFSLLAWGEIIRENPATIWFSIPILLFSAVWSWLSDNREQLAGSFGHLGIAFELINKYHWRHPLFLDLAYWSFRKARRTGVGDGQPTVSLKLGSIAEQRGDLAAAKAFIEEGIGMCRKLKDVPQRAFLTAHLGRVKTKLGDFAGAKADLESSLKTLTKSIKRESTFRLQVWASTAEMGLAEWYLAAGDKKQAKTWADKVAARAAKHDLKTRNLDAAKLLSEITFSA